MSKGDKTAEADFDKAVKRKRDYYVGKPFNQRPEPQEPPVLKNKR